MYNGYSTINKSDSGKNKKKFIIGGALIFAAIAVFIAVVVFVLDNRQVEVPDLSGLTIDEANDLVFESELVVNRSEYVASDTVAEGLIVSQDPLAGEMVDKKSIITVTVSMGKGKGYVPDITGMTAEGAAEKLKEYGYIGAIRECDSVEPAGTVIKQDRKKGSEVEKGATIGYAISRGNMTYIPDVCGMWVEDAVSEMNAAGLNVDYVEVESSKEYGTVVKQSDTGTAYLGATIILSVSIGDDEWI